MADYLLRLLKEKIYFSKKNIDIMILIHYTLTFFWQINGKIINYL